MPVSELARSASTNITFVERTESLEHDLFDILRLLGYSIEPTKARVNTHCISSCEEVEPDHRVGASAGNNRVPKASPGQATRFTNWYDASSAAVVIRTFVEDFRLYGFSTAPHRMYDIPSH